MRNGYLTLRKSTGASDAIWTQRQHINEAAHIEEFPGLTDSNARTSRLFGSLQFLTICDAFRPVRQEQFNEPPYPAMFTLIIKWIDRDFARCYTDSIPSLQSTEFPSSPTQ